MCVPTQCNGEAELARSEKGQGSRKDRKKRMTQDIHTLMVTTCGFDDEQEQDSVMTTPTLKTMRSLEKEKRK